MNILSYLLNILSPPRCLACNCNMPIDSEAMFCYDCSKNYSLNDGATCNICGKPIHKDRDKSCASCKDGKIYYIKNVSRYKYNGCIKTAIQNMKFKKRCWISYKFGDAICRTVEKEYSDINFDMILYIPMSPLNEISRGFNQAYEMAAIVSKKLGIPIYTNIIRKRAGVKTQSGLKKKDRIENIKNAFVIFNSHLLENKTILLVDDVFTTGSTINECARVLKRNGAFAVYSVTLATVVQ